MNINWNLYRLFYYVALYGSTATASRNLYIAQPSVSIGIKQLEKSLEAKLFERSYKGMELTESGRLLFEKVSCALKYIEEAEAYFGDMHDIKKDSVRIAVIDTTMQFFLYPLMDRLHNEYPDINIELLNCDGIADAETLIEQNAADFGLMCDCSQCEGIENIPIMMVQDILVCNSKYYDRLNTKNLTVDQLRSLPLISYRNNSASRVCLDNYFCDNGGPMEFQYEFTHSNSILRHLSLNFSLAFVLENTVSELLSDDTLFKIDLTPQIPPRYYYLLRPHKMSATTASFVSTIINAAKV